MFKWWLRLHLRINIGAWSWIRILWINSHFFIINYCFLSECVFRCTCLNWFIIIVMDRRWYLKLIFWNVAIKWYFLNRYELYISAQGKPWSFLFTGILIPKCFKIVFARWGRCETLCEVRAITISNSSSRGLSINKISTIRIKRTSKCKRTYIGFGY